MSFARDVKLEVPCTGPVPDTLKTLHCLIEKSRGNPDSRRLWFIIQSDLHTRNNVFSAAANLSLAPYTEAPTN